MAETEEAYFDLENEVFKLQQQVAEVEGLKEARDQIAQDKIDQQLEEYQAKAEQWPEIVNHYFDAKSEFETAKL